MKRRYAIIIPLHDEEACIGPTLDELLGAIPDDFVVAVGLNGCSDGTETVCRSRDVLLGETEVTGYGHGCLAAIEAVRNEGLEPAAYVFYAGDGADRPRDALRLVARFEEDPETRFVMGLRRFRWRRWASEFGRALPNLVLGAVCRLLGGRFHHDLGPLRLIERDLFEQMAPREGTWGWTIEAQIRAAQMGIPIATIPVEERPRSAGKQKVSGVGLRRSLRIGLAIAAAGWRTARRKDASPGGGASSQRGYREMDPDYRQ